MNKFYYHSARVGIGLFLALGLALVWAMFPQVRPAQAAPTVQDDPVKYGEYLAGLAGCRDCHTPLTAEGQLDLQRAFAGGQEFALGPLGKAVSTNLTPDTVTGLGTWSDEQLRLAIRTGLSKDGHQLFPIMPYLIFNNMADADVDAIIAYLRSLKPINNLTAKSEINVPQDALPRIPERTGLTAPAATDTAARGRYLMTAILTCNDCHTPLDDKTGQPIMEKYLAGGQPYEGPWGIIYSANLTPDAETGLGKWADADIERVIHTGVRPDGRLVVLMPWQAYAGITDDDLKAMINYLRNDVTPVLNEVPEPVLNEGFRIMVEIPQESEPASVWPWLVGGLIGLIILGGAVVVVRRNTTSKIAP